MPSSRELNQQKPSVGRIVIYVGKSNNSDEKIFVPGIILLVEEDGVTLELFGVPVDSEMRHPQGVAFDENQELDTWHWPPRV